MKPTNPVGLKNHPGEIGGRRSFMSLKNNLFQYATKELSQDAFICWLCSFALEDASKDDMALVTCAKELASEFLERGLNKEINQEHVILNQVFSPI